MYINKVAIWGTGEIYKQAKEENLFEEIEIVCFIDNAVQDKGSTYENKRVYLPVDFMENSIAVDYILVMNNFSEEIYQQCLELKFDMGKIIFFKNYKIRKAEICLINERQISHEELFPKLAEKMQNNLNDYKNELLNKLLCYKCGSNSNSFILHGKFADELYEGDYFRYRTFELVADQIIKNHVEGAIAEVGVFRGDFSALLNIKFSDRLLYMFDTFCSFHKTEFDDEVKKGRWFESAYDIFRNTSIEVVLKKMAYPDKCIIKRGLFPDSAKGINVKFAFVSLDVDLEDSTYYSLEYLYPRITSKGYIFIHDYNNCILGGVQEAIAKYEKNYGISLCKIPIADRGGTLIVYKP